MQLQLISSPTKPLPATPIDFAIIFFAHSPYGQTPLRGSSQRRRDIAIDSTRNPPILQMMYSLAPSLQQRSP
ncbi:unnamed protein product, partial [Vitis vinifera]|uniref:Uncharacterized protein n=1 Tax=Vitis vinifera TaxID=29760 RepID=D7TBC9_VITVI